MNKENNMGGILVLLAFVCFILAAFGVNRFGVELLPLGLAFMAGANLIGWVKTLF